MQKDQVKVVNNTGISALTLLGICFIVLKLTNYINWSWWLVLLPFYGLPVAFLGITGIAFMAWCGFTGTKMLLRKRKNNG